MNVAALTTGCIKWIKDWFDHDSGGAEGVILGISGGKDSAVVAALCCEAIGSDKVFGVLMPNGVQSDYCDSELVCKHLGINNTTVNIKPMYDSMLLQFSMFNHLELDNSVKVNILPRIRMTVLYALGQSMRYRVAGTGNFSERFVGYTTKFGDGASDFNPIGELSTDEVIAIGLFLGLPNNIVCKPPADGLWGNTDEEQLGVTYKAINEYIRGIFDNITEEEVKKIRNLHRISRHKLEPIPMYLPNVSHLE